MKIIHTDELTPLSMPSSREEKDWIYNGLDCAVTFEVFEALSRDINNIGASTYAFERSLQGPVLDMNMRGVLIDMEERDGLIKSYEADIERVSEAFYRLVREGIGSSVVANWQSVQQLKKLVYEEMRLPTVKRKGKITLDRDAIESLTTSYFDFEPIGRHILALRDIAKKIQTLKTEVDPDFRMRTSYSIAGTKTGRFSSSFNEFGDSGGNLQNIEQRLRRIFVADPGMKMAYIDKEQGESRLVGAIEWNTFHDGRYLDACESGDLHTSVCRMAWTDLPWTGDLKADRELAEHPFYRQHSYRHMAKVLGHGSNYDGQPPTMSLHTKLPQDPIRAFQAKYFGAFPHKDWHEDVRRRLWNDGFLISLTGRLRWFFGRRNDADTQREAIAYDPQGSLADILNGDMLAVWRLNICQLLLQVHDAILIQYPEELEDEIIPQVLAAMKRPIRLNHNREFFVPNDVKTGWNWADFVDEAGQASAAKRGLKIKLNFDGLKKWRGGDERKRQRTPKNNVLDRRFL